MENNLSYIPHFTFSPKKLKEISTQVEKAYKNIDEASARKQAAMRLPKLMEIIRALPIEKVISFADGLKAIEVKVLLYEIPFAEETDTTQHKINLIITQRYTPYYATYLWDLFQNSYETKYIKELIEMIWEKSELDFLGDEKAVQALNLIHKSTPDIILAIHTMLGSNILKLKTVFQQLRIKPKIKLSREFVYQYLINALTKNRCLELNDWEDIRSYMDDYTLDEYKQFVNVYVSARDYTQFNHEFLSYAIRRLFDPREQMRDWEFLSEDNLTKVKKWLIQNELQKFFTGDKDKRIDYWEKHMQEIDNVFQIKYQTNSRAAFIYFNQFVAVEFSPVGKVYFYHREAFDRFIFERTQTSEFNRASKTDKESILKQKTSVKNNMPFYIHDLGHYGDYTTWTNKFTNHVHAYLDGKFEYRW